MFNENRKIEFIQSCIDNPKKEKYFVNFFNRLDQKIESVFNKDFCDLNYEESMKYISEILGRSSSTIYVNLSILKDYNNWCYLKRYTNKQGVLEGISPENINNKSTLEKTLIKNPDHLEYVLDKIPESNENYITMDSMTKLYICLIYNGLTEDQAIDLKHSDIDLINDVFYVDGYPNPLYKMTKKFIKRIIGSKEIAVQRRNNVMFIELENTDKLIKLKENKDRKILFKNKIVELSKKLKSATGIELNLSTKRIYDSGMYFRLFEKESLGLVVDNPMIANEFKISKDSLNFTSYLKKVADIKKDYENWKKIL